MLTNFRALIKTAKKLKGRKIVVAGAEGRAVLEAVKLAEENHIMDPILIGNQDNICALAYDMGLSVDKMKIYDIRNDKQIVAKAVELVQKNIADGLMKGKVSTPTLLKAILDKKEELCTGRLLSHGALLEIPSYHKFLMVTDGGMIITPTVHQKVGILENGVRMMNKLGIKRPKVAILAAIEKVTPGMTETEDAEILMQKGENGELGDIEIEGPVAVDVAFSPEAARIKGVKSKISGDPDILLMPNISSGNIFAKAMWQLANAKSAGLILGTKMPIILLSRSDTAEMKFNSIALGVVTS